MSDLLILGTDTNAGKTTFACLWMAAFADEYGYWKPLETGESDSLAIRKLVPNATVHAPLLSCQKPVAPMLAAQLENKAIPSAALIAASRPESLPPLLVETFGGPFSPLNETQLQIELLHVLESPCVLITSSAVGAVGRILQSLTALASEGINPVAVVLLGEEDTFATTQIASRSDVGFVCCLQTPRAWTESGVKAAANAARAGLLEIRRLATVANGNANSFAQNLIDRDRGAVWHPYTSLGETADPLVCVGAQDEFLILEDGRRVIDTISSWWTILHSHRHPVLMAALGSASKQFDHVHFAGVTHEPAIELAELILRTTPWPNGRVFYSDNGSTAVEVSLKMAYQYWCHRGEPQRTCFVGFEHGYHGDTFGAMAVGRDPVFFGRFEPLLFRASIVPLSPAQLDDELCRARGKVAAVIVEPLVQAAGGMRMHSPELLRDLAEVTLRHDVLFIADEVMTGGGRTGTLWAHQAANIVPDLICTGKTLAGGVLPLAATMVAPHIVEAFRSEDRTKTFFHGHSFTAHPLACAVGVANWRKLIPGAMAHAARHEEFWQDRLSLLKKLPLIREARVLGSIAAVELAVEGGYLANIGSLIREICLKRRVLLRPLGNVVYAMPPLLTPNESLVQIADAIGAAVRSI